MAKMVTRTIISTRCVIMCVNTEAGEVFNDTIEIAGTYRDDAKLLKKVKQQYGETPTIKVVSIVSKEEIGTLYGVPEDQFLAIAKVLPARGTKAEESDTDETTEY